MTGYGVFPLPPVRVWFRDRERGWLEYNLPRLRARPALFPLPLPPCLVSLWIFRQATRGTTSRTGRGGPTATAQARQRGTDTARTQQTGKHQESGNLELSAYYLQQKSQGFPRLFVRRPCSKFPPVSIRQPANHCRQIVNRSGQLVNLACFSGLHPSPSSRSNFPFFLFYLLYTLVYLLSVFPSLFRTQKGPLALCCVVTRRGDYRGEK